MITAFINPNDASKNNGSALGAPSDFDIEYSNTQDYGPPMNEIEIYMTTITALEDLCFRDQSSTVAGYPHVPFRSPTKWSLPQYDVYLEISSQQVRYAIWGLQLTAGDVRRGGLWPVIARFFWREEFAGRVEFANKAYPLPPMDDDSLGVGKLNNATNNIEVNSTVTAVSSTVVLSDTGATTILDAARLTIVPRFNGVSLSPRAVFGTAINAMVIGAEYGPNTYCLNLLRAGVHVFGMKDAAGEPLLRYKSLIRAMSMLMSWMVVQERWGEIDVDIKRDEVLIGRIRFKKRARSTANEAGYYRDAISFTDPRELSSACENIGCLR